jgi:hypothetical protein
MLYDSTSDIEQEMLNIGEVTSKWTTTLANTYGGNLRIIMLACGSPPQEYRTYVSKFLI